MCSWIQVRTYEEEMKFISRGDTPCSFRIARGFVPNMNVSFNCIEIHMLKLCFWSVYGLPGRGCVLREPAARGPRARRAPGLLHSRNWRRWLPTRRQADCKCRRVARYRETLDRYARCCCIEVANLFILFAIILLLSMHALLLLLVLV